MDERLFRLRPDPAVFDTGTAQGKQLLLATTVHDILTHWFASDGEFLGLEPFRMPVEPGKFPGTTIHRTGSNYWKQVNREVAELKARIGFVRGDILIRKFESETASILDLPSEYVEFLENRKEYSDEDRAAFNEYIRKWRQAKDFVLEIYGIEYWMDEAGEVTHS
jgi:hypothetical protein